VSGAQFRYEPFPDLDLPLPARLGEYPRQPDLLLDAARALGRRAAVTFFRAQFRIEVVGSVPDLPRLALMPNHQSHLDTFALLAALPDRFRRRITVLAARDYFFERDVPALAASVFGQAVAFDRERGSAELRRWIRLLSATREGWFLVYPSGSRRRSVPHAGLAYTVARSGWPVLPVSLAGTGEAWPPGHRLWRPFRRLRVTFGEVLVAPSPRALVDAVEMHWAASASWGAPPRTQVTR
jgi:1-acyl-sn-glycerol-3-phosphate acyltransferase